MLLDSAAPGNLLFCHQPYLRFTDASFVRKEYSRCATSCSAKAVLYCSCCALLCDLCLLQLYFSSEWSSLLEVSFRNFTAGEGEEAVTQPAHLLMVGRAHPCVCGGGGVGYQRSYGLAWPA